MGRSKDLPRLRPFAHTAQEGTLCRRVQVRFWFLHHDEPARLMSNANDGRHEQLLDAGTKVLEIASNPGRVFEHDLNLATAHGRPQDSSVGHKVSHRIAYRLPFR